MESFKVEVISCFFFFFVIVATIFFLLYYNIYEIFSSFNSAIKRKEVYFISLAVIKANHFFNIITEMGKPSLENQIKNLLVLILIFIHFYMPTRTLLVCFLLIFKKKVDEYEKEEA